MSAKDCIENPRFRPRPGGGFRIQTAPEPPPSRKRFETDIRGTPIPYRPNETVTHLRETTRKIHTDFRNANFAAQRPEVLPSEKTSTQA